MPRQRKIKATAKAVQRSRADWYTYHYEQRQLVKALPPNELHAAQYIAGAIKPPTMTVYGGVSESFPESLCFELCGKHGVNPNLVNPWYLSDDGWAEFQRLWESLPEPVDIYENLSTPACVQIGELSTLSTIGIESEPGFSTFPQADHKVSTLNCDLSTGSCGEIQERTPLNSFLEE